MLDFTKPLPEGSYSWCSDCDFTDKTPQAHVNGKLHTDTLSHIVHLYTPGEES